LGITQRPSERERPLLAVARPAPSFPSFLLPLPSPPPLFLPPAGHAYCTRILFSRSSFHDASHVRGERRFQLSLRHDIPFQFPRRRNRFHSRGKRCLRTFNRRKNAILPAPPFLRRFAQTPPRLSAPLLLPWTIQVTFAPANVRVRIRPSAPASFKACGSTRSSKRVRLPAFPAEAGTPWGSSKNLQLLIPSFLPRLSIFSRDKRAGCPSSIPRRLNGDSNPCLSQPSAVSHRRPTLLPIRLCMSTTVTGELLRIASAHEIHATSIGPRSFSPRNLPPRFHHVLPQTNSAVL